MSSAWTLRFERRAEKDLSRLGTQDRQRVLQFLHDRLLQAPTPRSLGAALIGPLGGLWKYRVGGIRKARLSQTIVKTEIVEFHVLFHYRVQPSSSTVRP